MYGTHAYAINESFYDRMIKTPHTHGVIDTLYLNQSDRTYIVAKELLVLQDDNFESDLWGGKIKREKLYKDTYKKWIQ